MLFLFQRRDMDSLTGKIVSGWDNTQVVSHVDTQVVWQLEYFFKDMLYDTQVLRLMFQKSQGQPPEMYKTKPCK